MPANSLAASMWLGSCFRILRYISSASSPLPDSLCSIASLISSSKEVFAFASLPFPVFSAFSSASEISFESFFLQVYKFGQVRPILNKWHPHSKKTAYWFPSFFTVGFLLSLLLLIFDFKWGLYTYAAYFLVAFLMALKSTANIIVSVLCMPAILIQFSGYGLGFLKSTLKLKLSRKPETTLFPKLFFKS